MQIWFIEPNIGDDLATNDVNSERKREKCTILGYICG